MAFIQHLAIRSNNPERLAKFYEQTFGWTRLSTRPSGGVHLSDGHINVAILNTNGSPEGIEHFGVKLDAADDAGGLSQHAERRDATGIAAEHRVKDPDGNLIDLSVKGFMDRS
ncbi:MAG TPA: VOC family protein [Alphaproteobacteria bacterium]|nr:VOC family protein [Alphaproteobacteria bacterium]